MTKQEAIQAQMDDIMDTFDFESVAKWMKHTNWRWGQEEPPEIYEIKRAARDRLRGAVNGGMSSTGGFTATFEDKSDEDGHWVRLNLSFGYSTHNDGTGYTP